MSGFAFDLILPSNYAFLTSKQHVALTGGLQTSRNAIDSSPESVLPRI
jgi:hypothetical protein